MFFSCQEKENETQTPPPVVEPVFPTLVTNNQVTPGQELEFEFTPNMDWEISLSEGSFEYFKLLEENGRQRERLSGKASESPITVRIWVNPLEEFDTNRSCTLTMTMGGKSEVVAEYMRPAKSRVVSVYAAKVQDGVFVTTETGAYVYDTVEAQNVEVLWSEADAAFLLPIMIESNCTWDIDRTTFPSWLELNVPNVTEGRVELVVKGISLQAASGKMTFVSGTLAKEVNVSIASCSEMSIYSAKYEQGDWVYVDGGYEYTGDPVETITMVWTGNDCRIPVKVNSKCEWSIEKPEWITAEFDDRRSGEDLFIFKCDPQAYPLDDTEVTVSFKYAGQVIKSLRIMIPGCRDMISYSLGLSLTSIEFNYSGQYKTTSGYMEAPLKGSVIAHSAMTVRTVEIIDGKFVETVPTWLNCELNVDADTDTKLVLQNKSIEISVRENLTQTQRSAYIFLLPRPVENLSELFEEDQCTVREAYLRYAIPVVQAFLPADYLTPELSAEEMAVEGAYIAKSEKGELYECFGTTRYAYEIKYENTWSGDVAKMYLTYPYAVVEFYDAEKQLVMDKDNFWINFTDYMENKTFGAITIPVGKKGPDGEWIDITPVAGTSYIVFKDENGGTLCVVEFTYAPIIVEPDPEPDPEPEPDVTVEDEVADASEFFDDKNAATSAGATLVEVLAVRVPQITAESTQEEKDLAAYKKSLTTTLKECQHNEAPLYRLTYKNVDTELTFDFTGRLKNVGEMFTVNPYSASDLIRVDGKTQNEDYYLVEWGSTKKYHGKPKIKMSSFASLDETTRKTIPIKILFYDKDNKILLAVECILNE